MLIIPTGGGLPVGYLPSVEELNLESPTQIHLVTGRRIWTQDLWITNPAP